MTGVVREAAFAPVGHRRSVLDRAHQGEVVGALGRLGTTGAPARQRRLAGLLAVLGPGVVVMVADNDAGSISAYTQMGHDRALVVAALLIPLGLCLFVNQEMCARLGAVTGAGHARLIHDRFGRWWGRAALGDLVVLNLLLLVTELIGVSLGLGYFGVSRSIAVPAAAVALVALGGRGGFRRWERAMFAMVVISFAALPLVALVAHHAHHVATAGGSVGMLTVVLALAGATVTPWQLFFHQSNVVDKRITPRLLHLERADTAIGVGAFLIGAFALVTVGTVAGGTPISNAGGIAAGLAAASGHWAGDLFALVLIDGSLLAAAAVSLSTAYAVGEVRGTRHSLHRPWREARAFHATRAMAVAGAAAIALIPGSPLGEVTVAIQVLAAVLLPGALVLLLLLANDRAVLGPWTNGRWGNVAAGASIGGLLVLSALLMASGVGVHLATDPIAATVALVAGAAAGGLVASRLTTSVADTLVGADPGWTMPRLEQLPPAGPSRARRTGLAVVRCYALLGALLVAWELGRHLLRL